MTAFSCLFRYGCAGFYFFHQVVFLSLIGVCGNVKNHYFTQPGKNLWFLRKDVSIIFFSQQCEQYNTNIFLSFSLFKFLFIKGIQNESTRILCLYYKRLEMDFCIIELLTFLCYFIMYKGSLYFLSFPNIFTVKIQ